MPDFEKIGTVAPAISFAAIGIDGDHIAKTAERKPGSYPAELAQVCDLTRLSEDAQDALLAATDVGEVWGVGPRIGAQLREAGVCTALDLGGGAAGASHPGHGQAGRRGSASRSTRAAMRWPRPA